MSTSPPDPAFEVDGSLRDVYVAPVSIREWREALRYFSSRGGPLHFTLSGTNYPLPAATEEYFSFRLAREPLLRFEVAGIGISCHFFSPTELELSIVPNHVRGAEQVTALRGFLSGLAATLRKEVRLTRENLREEILWRVPAVP
jgi:hypothetical protein